MTLVSKSATVVGWDITVSIAKTELASGGVRYSQRVELQKVK